MSKLMKKYAVVGVLGLLAVFVGGYFYFSQSKAPAYDFVLAKKGDVVQEVSVTGKVKPTASVNLAFERGGRTIWVGVKVGERVLSGQVLARLYSGDLDARLSQAKANARVEGAKLAELKNGTRPEQIKIQEAKVAKVETAFNESKKNLINKIWDAYIRSDDAIRNKTDQFFSNPRSSRPQLNLVISDSKAKVGIENDRLKIENTLLLWKTALNSLSVSSDLNSYSNKAKQNLGEIRSILDKIALAVNSLAMSSNAIWKADVSVARTSVNTATAGFLSALDGFKSAQNNFLLEKNELALENAGATAEQIAAQEAMLESAEANVSDILAQTTKTSLVSPISGVVTVVDAKVGEIAAANATVFSVISSGWKIEANIPEADIAKVKIGQTAKLTLDAYGDGVVFKAKVISIDPAATIIEGVPTYKTTLWFLDGDKRIKPGMTANLEIATGSRKNVIDIPQRAVIEKNNGEKIVRVVEENGTIKEIKVKTGLRGSLGEVEILEGVKEGDKVIIFMKEQ